MQYSTAYGTVDMREPANDCATVTQQARVGEPARAISAPACTGTCSRKQPSPSPAPARSPSSAPTSLAAQPQGRATSLNQSGRSRDPIALLRGARRTARAAKEGGGREEALAAGARAARARLGVQRRRKGREEVTRKGGEGVAEGEERGDGRGWKGRLSRGGKWRRQRRKGEVAREGRGNNRGRKG